MVADSDCVGDVCDPAGGNGDLDGNGVFDGNDTAAFTSCYTGGNATGACAAADLDADGDIDDVDVNLFVQALLGL